MMLNNIQWKKIARIGVTCLLSGVVTVAFSSQTMAGENGNDVLVWDFADGELGDWAAGDGTASIEVSDEQAYEGDNSVKLVKGTDNLAINMQNDNVDRVQEGTEVSMMVWISQDHLDDLNGLQVFYQDAGWGWEAEWYGADGLTGDDWNEVSVTVGEFGAPMNRVGVQALFLEGQEALEGVIYVDLITFDGVAEVETFAVTFNVDMADAEEFDPGDHELYISGTLNDWAEPGSDPDVLMSPVEEGSDIYTLVLNLEAGDYEYKYFFVETGETGWDGGEWDGPPDRVVSVTEDTEVNDVFAVLPEPDIEYPEPPHAIGDLLNVNHDFSLTDLAEGVITDDVEAWTFNITDAATFSIVDDEAQSGDQSLKIDFGDWDGSANDWHVEAVNEPIFPAEGDMIEMSVWMKADSDERVARLYIGLPASGNWDRYPSPGMDVELTEEWTQYTFAHEVSAFDEENTMRFGIAMNFEANDGSTIYIDNARVEKVLPVPRPPHAVDDILTYNGDFSLTDPAEGVTGDDVDAWSFNITDAATFSIVEDEVQSGDHALKIDFGEWDGNTANDWHIEAVNEPIFPAEGDRLEYSVWMKSDADAGIANFFIGLPASGNWARYPSGDATGGGGNMIDLNNEWTEYKFVHDVTAFDAENTMRIGIAMNFEENDGSIIYIDNLIVEKIGVVTSADEVLADQPREFNLRQNYPNPFNPVTTISYEVPQASHVTIDVYNVLGQHVMQLVNSEQSEGVHAVNFDATNFSSGVYIYRMQAGNFIQTRKMMLVK